ncbi:MAG: hypothetical protein HC897_18870 [Thermoanaerobaculia bacterium]|nr:hypothetical protein [Thermoanaerobaculia bacterium]
MGLFQKTSATGLTEQLNGHAHFIGMTMRLHVSLEIPMQKQDAARRMASASLAKLYVGCDDSDGFPELLVFLLGRWCPAEAEVLICAENPFASFASLPGHYRNNVFFYEKSVAARAMRVVDAVAIITRWTAEYHVVFFGDEMTLASVVAAPSQPIGKLGAKSSMGYQGSYLDKLALADPFIFLAHGHPSVEVIGTTHGVLRAFDSIRSLFTAEAREVAL